MGEAETRLPELARRAPAGEDILIGDGSGPLARLVPVGATCGARPRRPGDGEGRLLRMAPELDTTPEAFEHYNST